LQQLPQQEVPDAELNEEYVTTSSEDYMTSAIESDISSEDDGQLVRQEENTGRRLCCVV